MEDLKSLKLLIIRSQAGDLDAFGAIVQRFQDMAVGYAYSILGDFHLAEDAAQEAFIEAYCCLSKLGNPDAFPGWFRKIVFKHCDRLTRGKRVETVPMEAMVEIASREKNPLEILEEQEMKDKVLAAIAALPEHERVVTTLFYINGYSQNEIADFLEIPVTTVNSRLRYSRKRLKERMMTMVLQDTLHENRPSRNNQFVERVLQFPKDRSIGTLYVRDGIDVPAGADGAALRFADWVEFGQARDNVKVQAGQALTLRMGREEKNNLAALASLSPNDLQGLEVGHIDNNDDFRFMTHFRDLRYVSIFNRGRNLGDEGLARLIKGLPKLRGLKLQGFCNIDTALAPLRELPEFHTLFMTVIYLTERAWNDVAQIPKLDSFMVDNINLSDAAAMQFKFLPVPYLSLACSYITDEAIFHLAKLHKRTGTPLMQLEIYDTGVSDEGLESLFQSIPKEKVKILLIDTGNVTGRILSELKGMTNLHQLRLSKLGDADIQQLAELSLPNLRWLGIQGGKITDKSVEYLAKLKNLCQLQWLTSTRISKIGVEELRKALPECEIQ